MSTKSKLLARLLGQGESSKEGSEQGLAESNKENGGGNGALNSGSHGAANPSFLDAIKARGGKASAGGESLLEEVSNVPPPAPPSFLDAIKARRIE